MTAPLELIAVLSTHVVRAQCRCLFLAEIPRRTSRRGSDTLQVDHFINTQAAFNSQLHPKSHKLSFQSSSSSIKSPHILVNASFYPHTNMSVRNAGKAGSWYVASPDELGSGLDEYLSDVPGTIDGSSLPIPGARIIIAPYVPYRHISISEVLFH